MSHADVVVAVCTFRRPEQLAVLLEHLQQQELPHDRQGVEIVVVDNSPDHEAAEVVERSDGPLPVRYVAWGAGNIASGRNETLRQARDHADFIALIDDDEIPEPDWLRRLLEGQAVSGADVVTGPVLARYPEGTASWRQQDEFYSVVGPADGAYVEEAVSGNALVSAALVRRLSLCFDESLGTSGGEDQLFFRSVVAGGGRLWYAPHARVHESVPAERLTVRYLLRREYRKGNTLGLLDRSRPGWPAGRPGRRLLASAYWLVTGLLRSLHGAGRRDRAAAVSGAMRVARSAGMVSGLLGRTFVHYVQPTGRRPVVALVTGEDPAYQAAGHSHYLSGFVRHYERAGARVVVVLTDPRLGFLLRRTDGHTSYRSPALRTVGRWQAVVSPRVLVTQSAWRAFRLAPRRIQQGIDGARNAVRSRQHVDHRLGSWLTPSQQRQVTQALHAEAPDVVLFSGLFSVPRPLVLPDSVRASVLLNHDVVSERAEQFRERGYRVAPAEFSEVDERAVLRSFSTIIAIQWDDAAAFQRLAPDSRVVVVPVAVDRALQGREEAQEGRCVFVGSGSLPNVDGLRWFLDTCWHSVRARVPHAELHVVGTVCARIGSVPEGVVLRGEVPDLATEYGLAAVAVVPLLTGSGLKVKIVEAICAGLPVVTTPVGAQGLTGLSPRPFVVAETSEAFAEQLVSLFGNGTHRRQLEHAAHEAAPLFSPDRVFDDLDDVLRAAGVPVARPV